MGRGTHAGAVALMLEGAWEGGGGVGGVALMLCQMNRSSCHVEAEDPFVNNNKIICLAKNQPIADLQKKDTNGFQNYF